MERMVVYIVYEVDDPFEFVIFVADTIKECALFLGCTISSVHYSSFNGRVINGKYLVERVLIDD